MQKVLLDCPSIFDCGHALAVHYCKNYTDVTLVLLRCCLSVDDLQHRNLKKNLRTPKPSPVGPGCGQRKRMESIILLPRLKPVFIGCPLWGSTNVAAAAVGGGGAPRVMLADWAQGGNP